MLLYKIISMKKELGHRPDLWEELMDSTSLEGHARK
jgi:hypothetical protein